VGAQAPVSQPNGTLDYTDNEPSGFRLQQQNLAYLALDEDDPSFNWRVFNLDRDLPRLRIMSEILTPDDPDLAAFRKHGAKLIMYHGWADPGISAYGTVEYYDRVVEAAGGQDAADDFVRLYLAPGMHHCSGGPGPNTFDMLSVLEAWVERGVAPSRVVASHATNGVVDRTRPLCPHPQVARYVGRGSIDDEANFVCQTPPASSGGAWLDRPLQNWNAPGAPVPPARAATDESLAEVSARCQIAPRATSAAERAVGSAGWLPFLLFDREITGHGVEVVGGMTAADGMCRPMEFHAFVFVDGTFAGTLTPHPTSSREDGVFGAVRLLDHETVSAEFARYTSADALCCPSRRMTARFTITRGSAPVVSPADVRTTREF
jgi:hypothetical protein